MPPVKTPAGVAELQQRTRGLSQRHRTVLLLVDGRRSIDEVLSLAAQAGVPLECFRELVVDGLVDAHPGMPEESLLPSVATLAPESSHWGALDAAPVAEAADRPLQEARELLVRAVTREAPVSGQLLLLKLRRAASREEVEALLDEVEQRIRKPRKQIVAAQTMRHVRHLLTLPA
jgi:hypothetical protein